MRRSLKVLGLAQVFALFGSALTLACGNPPSDDAATGGAVGVGGSVSGGTASGGGASTGGQASGGAASGGAAASGGQASGGLGGEASGGGGSGGASGGGASEVCHSGVLDTRLPCLLSETGLYEGDMKTLAEGVRLFTPQFPLWTDEAEKKRWIYLPPGTKVDTTNMDFWQYPEGTKFWKEFVRDGKRIETRLLERRDQLGKWFMVAYKWNDDQMDAVAVPDGELNASGTEHDIPNADQCVTCHSQQTDSIMGFSAIQLSHDGANQDDPLELNIDKLIAGDLLTAPPAGRFEFSSGWSELEKSVFGYMQGNCGTCHNPMGSANSTTGLDVFLRTADLAKTAKESTAYMNTVDVDITKLDGNPPGATKRFSPGSLDDSAVYERYFNKGQTWSMPPLGSEIADPKGQQLFEDFIMSLP